MPVSPVRTSRLVLGLAACTMAVGCGSFNNATQRLAGAITPYKIQVVQGNFISREQVESLKPGMSRQQVRDVLGTPLVASVFHDNRWDYVFTLQRQGVEPQSRRLTVYFKGNELERFEGDTMPSESEFVAAIDAKRRGKAVPQLEATEAQLKRYDSAASNAQSAAPAQPEPQAARSYPPLEPGAR